MKVRSLNMLYRPAVLLACLTAVGLAPRTARANTLTVTSNDDNGPNTLRQAVADSAAGDTINFGVTGTITLTSGEIVIDKDITINGPGPRSSDLIISGNDASRIFNIQQGNFTISRLTISHGYTSLGAGVLGGARDGKLVISDCTFASNTSDFTSALYTYSNDATVQRCTFTGNYGAYGGALTNDGTLTVSNSTFTGNNATANDATGADFGGGAIYTNGPLTLNNCTIANNQSINGYAGGGGLAVNGQSGVATVTNTIISDNSSNGGGPDISGTIASGDYNLIQDPNGWAFATDGGHNVVGVSANLADLSDNGGATQTLGLVAGSAAINAGDPSHLAGLPDDFEQRGSGFPRVVDGRMDIGAFEGTVTATSPDTPQSGSTLVVNSSNDKNDGVCGVAHCSLREAINSANAQPGTTIAFNIPSTDAGNSNGLCTIKATRSLPIITADGTVVNGYTQPGAKANTLATGTDAVLNVVVSGEIAPADIVGLQVRAANCLLKGLVVNNFHDNSVQVVFDGPTATHNTIEGCYIGTTASGNGSASYNGWYGLGVSGPNNMIGGLAPSARNVFCGCVYDGVNFGLASATGNTLLNNYIGISADGTTAIGNGLYGVEIYVGAHGNVVGGASVAARNVISGNGSAGIFMQQSGDADVVQGNYIGTNATGTNAVPNQNGLVIAGGSNNVVGGVNAGEGNRIAYNIGSGIAVGDGTGNAFRGNAIYGNGGLGINLGGGVEDSYGVTANDDSDADTGPNNLQNYPVLTAAAIGSSSTIKGTLNSTPNTPFQVDFYTTPQADASGYGQGQNYLVSQAVTTDSMGNASFTVPTTLQLNQYVTATATDANGNTSEFAKCTPVVSQVAASTSQVDLSGNPQPVTVTPPASNTSLTFADITQAGTVSVTTTTGGPPPPSGISFGTATDPAPTYVDIKLSNTLQFQGGVYVTFAYDPHAYADPSSLVLMHYSSVSQQWENITTANDTTRGIITGLTTSFSPFAIGAVVANTANAKITGGGNLNAKARKATFAFTISTDASGKPRGTLTYQDPVYGRKVQSTSLSKVLITGTHALVVGKATVGGKGDYTFTANLDDVAEPGTGKDRFQISLSDGYSNGSVLGGGNIQLH